MNEWELLKENVEPIKSGRSIKTLKSALNQKPNEVEARELKRKEFESELQTYSGSDLLSVYYDYILWIEQNYPLGGNEGNLKTLLEKCIEQFHTEEQYQNDDRLLKVFLKFIKYIKDSPLELFTFFHSSGFATKLAEFYINWSFHLENHKNCRKAAEVLREGIAEKAEPTAALKRSLDELEVRVAKAVANQQMDELNDNDSEEQQRQALNNLKTKTRGGKTVAPVNRIGKAIKDRATGLKASKPVANSGQTKTKTPAIYCDENDPSVATKPSAQPVVTRSVKAVATVGQENEQKPGKWSENALPAQKPVATESQPKFTIHADDSDEELSPEPVRKPIESNTLKMRPKNADSPPVARFEKPNPNIKYAYNESKMYPWGVKGPEFSFEEIRGRRWFARKKKEEEALKNKKLEEEVAQLRLKKEEDALRSQKLEEELSQLRRKVDGFDELRRQVELLKAQSSQQSSQPVQEIVVHKNESQETKGSGRPKSASPVLSSAESSTAKSGSNTTNNQTNVTANGTKAAYSLVRDLWDGTLANQTGDICQENNAKFDINAVIDKTEEQVQKKEAFAIFSDTTLMSKAEDRGHRPRESIGLIDYTIALPKTEMTFIGNAHCASTPVADKSKKSEPSYNFNAIQSLNNNYNFVGGMTAKLSPIVETSREYNSKSSSSGTSSSGTMSSTGGQALSRRQRALSGVENIDPFDVSLLSQLLGSLAEPIDSRKGFFRTKKSLPKIKQSETRLNLGPDLYQINKLIATGAYAQVFTAQIDANNDENDSCGYNMFMAQKWYALKIARHANEWEFYICDELQKRLSRSKSLPDIELSVMAANPTVMFKDTCVLVDEFAPDGTLIDVINHCKEQTTTQQPFPNSLTAFFALELIQIVRQIHRQHIIHADIKPDNILVLNFPSKEEINNVLKRTSSLKVIDFGRSIDMSLFPDGTTFNLTVNTKGSQCCEMLDSKPWTYQTDWFGVLDCIHVMLFGDYIKVHKNKDSKWEIKEKFRRYHLTNIWIPLFDTLLNIEDCYLINGVLEPFVKQLDDYIRDNVNDLVKDAVRIEKLNDSALKKRK